MPLQRVLYKDQLSLKTTEINNDGMSKLNIIEKNPIVYVNMEIIGEVEPELVTSCSNLYDCKNGQFPFIYEYMWNLGINGSGFDWLNTLDEDDAILVQIIIEVDHSQFTSKEIFATLEYLPPTLNIKEKPNILSTIARGAGEAVKVAGNPILSSLGVFVSNVIPSENHDNNHQCKWYLKKFDYPKYLSQSELAYGLEWHISKYLVKEIGSRIVGRIGVIFIHAPIQNYSESLDHDCFSIFGRFGLKIKTQEEKFNDFLMLPHEDSLKKLQLQIHPRLS